MAVGRILRDDGGDVAAGILLKLDKRSLEAPVDVAGFVAEVAESAAESGAIFYALIGRVGAVAGGVGLVEFGLADAALEAHVPVAGGFQQIGQPVDQFAGVVHPDLDEVGVHIAAGVTQDVMQRLGLVDLELGILGKALKLESGVNGADILADAGHVLALFDHQDLRALLGGGHRGHDSAGAAADDEDFGVEGLRDVAFGDNGRFAQPVGIGNDGLCDGDGLAAGLRDTVGHSFFDCVRGDGRAGDGVDVRPLSGQHGLLHVGTDLSADVLRLAGDIDLDVGDGSLAEGHRDGDVAGYASRRGGVSAGSVDGFSRRGTCRCSRFRRGRRGRSLAAAAQNAHSGHAHGASSHAFEKVSAGELFVCHGVSSCIMKIIPKLKASVYCPDASFMRRLSPLPVRPPG